MKNKRITICPRFVIPQDWILLIIVGIMCVMNYLPFVHILPQIVISVFEVGLAGLFYIYVLSVDSKMFLINIGILILTSIVNLWAYYRCWYNINTIGAFMIQSEMCWIYMQIGVFVVKYGSKTTKKSLLYILLITICLTCITSIAVSRNYPTAMRGLNNGSVDIKGQEPFFYKKNTATWSMIFGMVFMLPYLIQMYKQSRKMLLLLSILLICYCIYKSQITMGLLMALLSIIFFIKKPIPMKRIIIFSVLIIGIISLLSNYLAEIVYWIFIHLFDGSRETMLGNRIYQIYLSVNNHQLDGTFAGRYDLYYTSIKDFLHNPIIGMNIRGEGRIAYEQLTSIIGLHSQVFDLLATTGILGTGIMAWTFIYLTKAMYKNIREQIEKNVFSFGVVLLIALMILNPTYYSSCVYLIAFIGPSLLQRMEKERIQNSRLLSDIVLSL